MLRRALFALGIVVATASSCREEATPRPGGARLHVLFDERHSLEGGEAVRLHDFEVGHVESVDLADARVRASLSLEPKVLEQLTRETTASVEEHDSARVLLLHVLDPEAEKLTEGATLVGVDSGVELTLRRASVGASKLMRSDWVKEAKEALSQAEREIEAIDWGEKKEEVHEKLDQARRVVEEAAGEGAKKGLETAGEELEKIAKELEALGRSDQAKKLRELAKKILGG